MRGLLCGHRLTSSFSDPSHFDMTAFAADYDYDYDRDYDYDYDYEHRLMFVIIIIITLLYD